MRPQDRGRAPDGPVMRIGDVARDLGVSASTLRLWEAQGLVHPARRSDRSRAYSEADLARLRAVRAWRQGDGLNAAAIRHLLNGGPLRPHAPEGGGWIPASSREPGAGDAAGLGAGPDGPGPGADASTPERLRALRRSRGLSLRAAAARSGLSPSFISAVERSQARASAATLHRLAQAYGSSLAEVTADPRSAGRRLVRAAERAAVELPDGLTRIEQLAATPSLLQSEVFVLRPGATSGEAYSHPGDELLYLLCGRLAVWLEPDEYHELGPGDALSFPSRIPHRFLAVAHEDTRVLWVNTPPTF